MNSMLNSPGKQSGLSMIEVLVTLVILMVGLLGLAGLQTQGLRSEMESYQRVQALILLQDMVGRINANRGNNSVPTDCSALTGTALYACQWTNITANVNAYVANANNIGTGDGQPTVCTALSGQARDRCEWSNALKGAGETTSAGTSFVGAMIGGRGCVTLVSSDASQISVLVSVAWQGMGKTFSQTTNLCGKDQYGDDAQRRVVNLTVKIGNLSAP